MEFSFKEIIGAFMVLFAVIDITGSIPIILDMKSKGSQIKPLFAASISMVLLIFFLFAGDALLALFGVDVKSFAVAGAIVLFVLAIEMLMGVEIMKYNGPGGSATLVPLVFPLIAGAGTLTTLIAMRAEYHVENIIMAIILNMILVYFVLRHLSWIERKFGNSVIYILRKFFGIILLAISVKLFAANIMEMFK